MLKQIAVSELEVGMFVHKFEGGWFDHPFWKAKFLIEDAEKLAAIRDSRVRAVVIDTERGRDLVIAAPAAARAACAASAATAPPSASRVRNLKQRTAVQVAAACRSAWRRSSTMRRPLPNRRRPS